MKRVLTTILLFAVSLTVSLNAYSQEIRDVEMIKSIKSPHGTYKDHVSFTIDGQPRKGIRYLIDKDGFNPYQIAYEVDKFMHNGKAKYVLPTYTYVESNARTYVVQEIIEDADVKIGEEIPDDIKMLDLILGITSRYSPGLNV
jgi:hypothetical protein